MARPTVIVENHQTMPWIDEGHPFGEATIQRHLLSQELGEPTLCLVQIVKTAAIACQRQRSYKTVPVSILKAVFQPAGWVGDTIPSIRQDCNVTDRGLRRIIEWHV